MRMGGQTMKNFVLELLIGAMALSMNAYAQTQETSQLYTNYTGRGSGTVQRVQSAVNETPIVSAPTSNTINQGSQVAQGSQDSGSALNMLAAAALTAGCLAPCPKCAYALCAMAALAAMQGGHDSGAADLSGLTTNSSGVDSNSTATNDAKGSAGYSAKAALDRLKSGGYQISEKGLTNPDGSFTPASAFNSTASMSSAGIDAGVVKEAEKILAKVNADAARIRVASVPVDGAGGGGSGRGAASEDFGSDDGGANHGNPFALGSDQKNQLVAGKTVNFDGEPIGVSGQNLFEMIHTCYARKRAGNNFIETAGSERSPASVSAAGRTGLPLK